MRYELVDHQSDFDAQTGIRADFTIRLPTPKSRKLYPEPVRLVIYYDMETGNEVPFISNNFEISAIEVANLYRHRWDIEVFFKWIKQNIVVKTLWGYSENAVKTHLWVAMIAYLIIARLKATFKSPYTITEIATLVRLSALERTSLHELITKPQQNLLSHSMISPSLFNGL